MIQLSQHQLEIREKIQQISSLIGDDPIFASAVALVESSLGLQLKSPTGAKGVFGMTSIAMKDLLQEMDKKGNEVIGILCGLAFLHLLTKRHKTLDKVVLHFCNPADFDFYLPRVKEYMKELSND